MPNTVGASVGGVGENLEDRGVGGLDLCELLIASQMAVVRHGQVESLLFQLQPHPSCRAAERELLEDGRDHPSDGFVGVKRDPAFAPEKSHRQCRAQLASGRLVSDPAVQPGAQDVKLALRHRPFHAEQQRVVEQLRMVGAVAFANEGVGKPDEGEPHVRIDGLCG